jgi:hypothetical protein
MAIPNSRALTAAITATLAASAAAALGAAGVADSLGSSTPVVAALRAGAIVLALGLARGARKYISPGVKYMRRN